jgi:hypothetical protein
MYRTKAGGGLDLVQGSLFADLFLETKAPQGLS